MYKAGVFVCAITICCVIASPGRCVTIPLNAPKKDAALGVKISSQPVVDYSPPFPGMLEVLGIGDPFLDASQDSKYYTATASFKNPIDEVTFDVKRLNNSGWESRFTAAAFDNGKRIRLMSIELNPLGDDTQVTLRAPDITRLKWHGDGWTFHPYVLEGISVQFVTSSPPSVTTPIVSATNPVPDPGAVATLLMVLPMLLLLQRHRRPTNTLFR